MLNVEKNNFSADGNVSVSGIPSSASGIQSSVSGIPTLRPPPQSVRVKRADTLGDTKIVNQWASKDVNLRQNPVNSQLRADRTQSAFVNGDRGMGMNGDRGTTVNGRCMVNGRGVVNGESSVSNQLAALNLNGGGDLVMNKHDMKFDDRDRFSDNFCDIR